jgi:F0F1-type ATP synthase membrane subunit b/b'
MFELDLTFFIFLIMFLAFTKALNAVYLKPVGAVIAKRRSQIENDIKVGNDCREQAQHLVEGYEKDLHDIRHKAQAHINEVTTAAQKARTAELKKVMDEGQIKLAAAKKEIDADHASLLTELVEEEKGIVETIARKLLGANVTLKLDSAAVRTALEEAV